jgi:hypothetical protein
VFKNARANQKGKETNQQHRIRYKEEEAQKAALTVQQKVREF